MNQERKNKLIQDIQQLLNTYDSLNHTTINPALLEFMDEQTLIEIIDSLLTQKENAHKPDLEWLEQFKSSK
jgi:hypothetical protein